MLTMAFLIVWFFTILALGVGGAFESLWNGKPIGPPLALLIPLCLYFADLHWLKSRLFRGFWALDEKTAILLQAYRIVGVFFLVESMQGRLPLGFALPAGSGDILVGMLAPWVAWRLGETRRFATTMAIAWNLLGILDLVCAVSLGILYAPTSLGILAKDVTTRARHAVSVVPHPILGRPHFAHTPLSIAPGSAEKTATSAQPLGGVARRPRSAVAGGQRGRHIGSDRSAEGGTGPDTRHAKERKEPNHAHGPIRGRALRLLFAEENLRAGDHGI
jgi:hypothetical protein